MLYKCFITSETDERLAKKLAKILGTTEIAREPKTNEIPIEELERTESHSDKFLYDLWNTER